MREQFQSEFSIENHNSVRNMSSIHRLNKTLAQIICLDYSFSFSLVDTCSRQMIFRTLTAANDGMKRQFSISNNVDEALHSSHSFRRNDTVKKRRAVTLRDWNGHRQRIATYIQSIYGWKSDLLFSYSSKDDWKILQSISTPTSSNGQQLWWCQIHTCMKVLRAGFWVSRTFH